MASRGEELLISADSHVIEDPHFWENRLPAALKDQAPVFPEREMGGLFQAHAGGWDPHERVKEMAVDGVSGDVLYPSFAMKLFGLQDAALQEAMTLHRRGEQDSHHRSRGDAPGASCAGSLAPRLFRSAGN